MTWSLQDARLRLGLPADDTGRDAALTAAMGVALSAAEAYCDRKFLLQDEAENFRNPIGQALTVRRYPIASLTSLQYLPPLPEPPPDPAPIPSSWLMDADRGIVYLATNWWPWCSGLVAPPPPATTTPGVWFPQGFTLSYTGGFDLDALPGDLEAALWLAFDSTWYMTPGWGAAVGTNSAGPPIKSFSIDGMSVGYENPLMGGKGGKASGGATGAPGAWGLLPATAVAILEFYRADSSALGA